MLLECKSEGLQRRIIYAFGRIELGARLEGRLSLEARA